MLHNYFIYRAFLEVRVHYLLYTQTFLERLLLSVYLINRRSFSESSLNLLRLVLLFYISVRYFSILGEVIARSSRFRSRALMMLVHSIMTSRWRIGDLSRGISRELRLSFIILPGVGIHRPFDVTGVYPLLDHLEFPTVVADEQTALTSVDDSGLDEPNHVL